MAKLFIGVPTFNRAVFVRAAIESVLAQGIADFRLLVSDNCSAQEISEEIESYINQLDDPRVSFIRQTVNRGQNGQILYFLEQCGDEEFFAMLDDDDCYEEGFLTTAIDTLNSHQQISFFGSDQYLFDEDGQRLEDATLTYNADLGRNRMKQGEVPDLLELVLQRGVFSLSSTVFRTQSLRECGLLDSLDAYPPDFNIFVRQAERGKRAYWCPEKLGGYRWHKGQTRKQSNWEYDESLISRFQRLLEVRKYSGGPEKKRRWLLAFAYRRLAYISLIKGEYRPAYRLLLRTIRNDPFRWQAWIYLLFAVFFPFIVIWMWKPKVTLIENMPK